jgi:hypothetical protein
VDVRLQGSYAALDRCSEVGTEGDEAVSTVTLQLNGNKTREVDLCKRHREELIDDLLLPLMKDGRTVERSSGSKRKSSRTSADAAPGGAEAADGSGQADDLICRVEDCDRHGVPAKSTTGLAQHVIRSHGFKSLAEYYEATNSSG